MVCALATHFYYCLSSCFCSPSKNQLINFMCRRPDYFSIFCSKTCRSVSSILRKFADIGFSLVRIFVDISLPRKFASSIFRCPQRVCELECAFFCPLLLVFAALYALLPETKVRKISFHSIKQVQEAAVNVAITTRMTFCLF